MSLKLNIHQKQFLNQEFKNRYINKEKLEKYLTEDKITEFDSNEECLEFFNTYDYQNFKTVTEMINYQGKYGFNIGKKRYHINYDEALDVWKNGN